MISFSTGCQTIDNTGDFITDDATTATTTDVTEHSEDSSTQLIGVIVGVAGGSLCVILSVTVLVTSLMLLCAKFKQSRKGIHLQIACTPN